MVKFLTTLGILCIIVVVGLPMYANYTGGSISDAVDTPWYRPLIYTGAALIFIPSILGSFLGLRTVKSGQSAVGLIQKVSQTGTYVNSQPQLEIEVMVTRSGSAPYPAAFRAVIPQTALAQFQPGSIIPLLVSDKDPAKVGLDSKGQISQADVQALLNERMVQQGNVSPEMMYIAEHGEKLYAKIIEVVPLGSGKVNKIKLQLTLSVTRSNGEVITINTQKEIFESQLSHLQQGNIISVMYSSKYPSDVALMLPTGDQELHQVFGQS